MNPLGFHYICFAESCMSLFVNRKFTNKNTIAANQGTKTNDHSKRPGSAPIKRSNTSSKLQPMGKIPT